ncbi:enolase C-terminal domain-like protein [Kutzneria kofuensis]|uniref:L-alanine-DL-glutamate epimerase-like enolase superfamily enzyme n=1 Tax=Kutzneria kofuensis TaxID=103725 RepID=A0A7W9KR57_9PSEU|nr:enolase C-terminal domain-like protein [Kutzneria kofuensis]MBB5897179.1 L-alanine-DL-glutamate epimerase-like enolase superfamily enzyme [Kutzneria kofuensis]
MSDGHEVTSVEAAAYTVPTDGPEADGTLSWDATTIVVVTVRTRAGVTGVGHTYGHECLESLISGLLAPRVVGIDVRETGAAWEAMRSAIRNLGRPGLCSMAIAAVDMALWDAKARTLDVSLHRLLGGCRSEVPVYGSGGFTTYSRDDLVAQLAGWVEQGIPRVKMKIGISPEDDLERACAVRKAIGTDTELYVDANGAYDQVTALRLGRQLVEQADVTWFEEPVSSDDLPGLTDLSRDLPLDVTAGEYGYHLEYFQVMAPCVDVLQADITRCAGITEWLRVATATTKPFSGHCAPMAHVHAATVPPHLRHLEYFHDHVRIEQMLFDGVLEPVEGCLIPVETPGNGLVFKEADAERFRVR